MYKKIATLLTSMAVMASLVACGSSSGESSDTVVSSQDTTEEVSSEETASEESSETSEDTQVEEISSDSETEGVTLGLVDNTLAEDEEELIATYAEAFDQLTYTDEETGLTITYNLYLPEGYDESQEYPMVVFIGDSTCAGTDAEYSLTQGRGALVWASEEWQSVYPTIVAVPTYPETILDDQDGYNTTEYVELTKRFIDYMTEEYSVDTDRIYGTGQSMGCMTTLILASEYPDLYAACMFVDGQWDTSLLANLEGQTFVYFAAEDDTSAYNGMQELMSRFDEDSAEYTYVQWDGTWSVDDLSEAATELFTGEADGAYFISWATGSIDASTGSMGSMGGNGSSSRNNSDEAFDNANSDSSDDLSVDEAKQEARGDRSSAEGMQEGKGESSAEGMMGSVAYHMASFDYAYNCIAVMEWLFQQSN